MDDKPPEQKRFHSDKLVINPSTYEPFLPKEDGRDRFGNRIFRSPQLSYPSRREQIPIQAALLMSPAGENFVRSNAGILKDIDRGLVLLEPSVLALPPDRKDVDITPIELGNGRKMSYLSSGGQSHVFLLEVGQEKYVVKIRNTKIPEWQSVFQPYINEMLQTQSIQADLGTELAKLGIKLPSYLFASGQVECVKFEEGEHPTEGEIQRIANKLWSLLSDYIDKEKQVGNKLWQNVSVDLLDLAGAFGKTINYIRAPTDKRLVLIDMLTYQPPWSMKEVLEMRAAKGDEQAAKWLKEWF